MEISANLQNFEEKSKEIGVFQINSRNRKIREKSQYKEILRKNIKELAFTYRKQENSSIILDQLNSRVKSLEKSRFFTKNTKENTFEIPLILDCFEILFRFFFFKKRGFF